MTQIETRACRVPKVHFTEMAVSSVDEGNRLTIQCPLGATATQRPILQTSQVRLGVGRVMKKLVQGTHGHVSGGAGLSSGPAGLLTTTGHPPFFP